MACHERRGTNEYCLRWLWQFISVVIEENALDNSAADGLATIETKTSTAMIFSLFVQYMSVPALTWMIITDSLVLNQR